MQGVMGSFLEKNIQAFMDIQDRMAEQSKGMYGNQFGPEAWTQFMNMQAPVLQNMMSNYVDQNKNLFVQMQDQMQRSEEHTSELQSLMSISYAVFCLKKKNTTNNKIQH